MKLNNQKNEITCLLAGGSSFIGLSLTKLLIDQNCRVICLDKFDKLLEKKTNQFIKNPNFIKYDYDLATDKQIEITGNIDYIFHLALIESYFDGLEQSNEKLFNNIFGINQLLEFAIKNQAKFLLASTENILHQKSLSTSRFTDKRLSLENKYLGVKSTAEAMVAEYHQNQNLDSRVVRGAYLYGPFMNLRSNNLLTNIILEAITTQEIKLPNDGLFSIYPTHVDDFSYGLLKSMFSQSSNGKMYGLIDSKASTLLSIAYKVRDLLPQRVKISFLPSREVDLPLTLNEEIINSQEALGWYARKDLDQGLKETLNGIRVIKYQNKDLGKSKQDEQSTTKNSSNQDKEDVVAQQKNNQINRRPMFKSSIAALEFLPQEFKKNPIKEKIKNSLVKQKPFLQEGLAQEMPNQIEVRTITPKIVDKNPTLTIQPPIVDFNFRSQVKKLFKSVKLNKQGKTIFKLGKIGLIFLSLVFLYFLPTLLFLYSSDRGINNLRDLKNYYQSDNYSKLEKAIQNQKRYFSFSNTIYQTVFWQKNNLWLPLKEYYQDYLLYSDKLTTIYKNLSQLELLTAKVNDAMWGRGSQDLISLKSEIDANLGQSYEIISLLSLNKEKLENSSWVGDIDQIKQELVGYKRIWQIIPDLLSFSDRKTLLVLLQDNNELRPTGGFIEGVGILKLEKGRIMDFQVFTTEELDRKLKGVIIPPEELTKFMGEKGWFLRDSNISADFANEAGPRAAWFIQKELGESINGVIGVNLNFFKQILANTGSVFLPEFNEEIDTNNILGRSLNHVNLDLLETQKSPKFLNALALHLLEKIKAMDSNKILSLFPSITQSLESKDLIIFLPDTNITSSLNQWGYDGALRNSPTELLEFGSINFNDYLSIIEANLGINKVNYYVTRSLEQLVTIENDGTVNSQSLLTLNNSSSSQTWPAGNYKVLVKFYIPKDSKITELKIANVLNLEFKAIKTENFLIKEEFGKKSIAAFVEIEPNQSRVIKFNYSSSNKVDLNNQLINYGLYLQKQSGVASLPYKLTMNFPKNLRVAKLSSPAQISQGSLVVSKNLEKDDLFVVSFSR